jgi:hypothetical protein
MQGRPILNRLLHRTPRGPRTSAETLATSRSNTHRQKGAAKSMMATLFVGEVQQLHTMTKC